MDDVARGTSWLFRWLIRPNKVDDPEMAALKLARQHAANNDHALPKPPLQIAAE
jgi:hypothetical protein